MAADTDFFALRSFNRLHTRILLTRQAQLQGLENQLDALDNKCAAMSTKLSLNGLVDNVNLDGKGSQEGLRDVNNGTVLDDLPQRQELISRIQSVLSDY